MICIMDKLMKREYVEENLKVIRHGAVDYVPSLLEVRSFGSYQNGEWDPAKSDVDIMMLTGKEHLSALNFLRRDEGLRDEICKKVLMGTGDEFRARVDLKLVTLFDMDVLIGCDEGKGDIGRNMYGGDLLYSGVAWNPFVLRRYLAQKKHARFK